MGEEGRGEGDSRWYMLDTQCVIAEGVFNPIYKKVQPS